MIQIKSTETFACWLDNLKDLRARAKIQSTQKADIEKAKSLAKELGV
ncbi:hypothetical protein P9057_07680 [Gallibacterium anatis]|nr:hypothetical protein [Gallibacterium anatis]